MRIREWLRTAGARVADHRLACAAVGTGFLLLLSAPRLGHIRGPVDNPHSWRQCDTAQYALAFHREGIDLLAPSVNWMGGYKTVILEFPFPEMLMALAYRVFGYHLGVARLVTLLFFAGSAVYLFLILRRFAGPRLAAISAAVYTVMPLSLFYSRAIHIDFFAVCCAHAMTYHLLRAMAARAPAHLALGTAAAVLAFLIKAPYAFYFFLPLAVIAALRPSVRAFLAPGGALVTASVAFLLWRAHAAGVNGAAPDWSFIPGYFKLVDMDSWYYGALEMRWDQKVWTTLLGRLRNNVATSFGSVLFVAGAILSLLAALRGSWRRVLPLWTWLLGVLGYLLIFFNLNFVHDYYQIPMLAAAAVFVAIPVDFLFDLFRRWHPLAGVAASLALLVPFAVGALQTAERVFFKDDGIRVEAGAVIQARTPTGSLVVAAEDTQGTDCRDPRLLFPSQRYGWAISRRNLTPELLNSYRGLGANHLAILTRSATLTPADGDCQFAEYRLERKPWRVFIADLAQCRWAEQQVPPSVPPVRPPGPS